MENIINFQTDFFKDQFSLFYNNLRIGKVYKTEWLGSKIESEIYGSKFEFLNKGFITPTITIIDKKVGQSIGELIFSKLWTLKPIATLRTNDNQKFEWTRNSLFDNNWEWTNLKNGQKVIESEEALNIFRHTGSISISEKLDSNDLLIALGIHLRNVIQRKYHLVRVFGLTISIFLLFNFLKH